MTETSESAQARYVPPGTAEVILTLAGGAVEAVRIRSDGRARAVAALERGTADAAPALARLLFPVCGIAHEVALSHAIIAASEHSEPVPTADRSAGQVLAEAAVAHVWRAAIDWPAALNRPAHMEAAKRARAALDGYLHADGTTEDACETLAGLLGELGEVVLRIHALHALVDEQRVGPGDRLVVEVVQPLARGEPLEGGDEPLQGLEDRPAAQVGPGHPHVIAMVEGPQGAGLEGLDQLVIRHGPRDST